MLVKLSDHLAQLQRFLDKHGDAPLYYIDECGGKCDFHHDVSPECKIIKEAYWDWEKDELVDYEKFMEYYLMY